MGPILCFLMHSGNPVCRIAFLFSVFRQKKAITPEQASPFFVQSFMRRLFSLAPLLLATALCFASPINEPSSLGEWSKPVDGLRARLVLGEDPKLNGTRRAIIYLELQNHSLWETAYFYYDASKSPLQCTLRDPWGKTNVSKGAVYNGPIYAPCWLALPHDSTLRFRVTLPGFGIPKNAGLFLAGCLPDAWVIPASDTNQYFLSGTFTSTPPKSESRPRTWQGTLDLPELKVPVNQP